MATVTQTIREDILKGKTFTGPDLAKKHRCSMALPNLVVKKLKDEGYVFDERPQTNGNGSRLVRQLVRQVDASANGQTAEEATKQASEKNAGTQSAASVAAYLEALDLRVADRPALQAEHAAVVEDLLHNNLSVLDRLAAIQRRLDLEARLDRIAAADNIAALQKAFVVHAADYAARTGTTYKAFREFGVPAKVLRQAGIR